jgi:hypothetical protein
MFLNIELVRSKKGVRNGLRYQTKNGRGEILYGCPELVEYWATTSNNERAKAYSILISFKESREELERKLADRGYTLEELIEDVEKLVFAGYSREEIAYTMIAHSDTDNFHIHTYVANNFAGTGKSVKLWFHENDLAAIREYIDLKYGLDTNLSPKAGRTRKAGSYYWTGEARKREEAKDRIHEVIMKHVLQGNITDNKQVRERIELYTALAKGTVKEVEVKKTPEGIIEIDKSIRTYGDKVLVKLYKNSISVGNLILKGGIYRENWTANKNILEEKEELLNNLIRYLERRLKETEQKYKKERQKKQDGYEEEILGERFLNILKKKKAKKQQKQRQRQQQQNQQNQNQQPQNQPQPQTQQPQKQPANQKQPAIDNQTAREDYQQEQENIQDYQQDYTPRMRF